MVNMLRDVIMTLFAGSCYCAHTAEKWDTSTMTAGNDNTRNHESPEERVHPVQGGHIEDEALNMNHPLSGRKSIPSGHPLLRALIS